MRRFSDFQALTAAAAICGALAGAAPAAAANLLANGDFESPVTPTGGFTVFNGGQTIGGWTVLGATRGGAVQLLNTAFVERNNTFVAQSGQASMDLSGTDNSGPDSGIAQTVDTIKDQLYELTFWVGNADGSRNGNFTLPSTVNLRIDGGPLQAFTNADTTPLGLDWAEFQTTFVGTGARMEIAFLNGTPLRDSETGLDNVQLALAVPEPATWAMMIAGFGLTGASLRRRRWSVQARSILAA